MLATTVVLVLIHVIVAQQLPCTDRYFMDAVNHVNEDCCVAAPGMGHRRTQSNDGCNNVPRECVNAICANTFTEFFATCETQLRLSPAFTQYQELNSDCVEVLAAGCPPAYLGPDIGYIDLMERGPDGQCSLSTHSLSIVCSGEMFQTCIDFLHSSDMGPGDRNDPDYAAKHPKPEPWGGGR
jgi:hypothetical protein